MARKQIKVTATVNDWEVIDAAKKMNFAPGGEAERKFLSGKDIELVLSVDETTGESHIIAFAEANEGLLS